MRAVLIENEGSDASLSIGEAPSPELRPDDLRIATKAFAINRGDLMQRRGLYPPPPGASTIMGLECAAPKVLRAAKDYFQRLDAGEMPRRDK